MSNWSFQPIVEVVTANDPMPDGRSVRQMLIDTYAENEKKRNDIPPLDVGPLEQETVDDMRYGPKYPTSFIMQVRSCFTYTTNSQTYIFPAVMCNDNARLLATSRRYPKLDANDNHRLYRYHKWSSMVPNVKRWCGSHHPCPLYYQTLTARKQIEDSLGDRGGFLFFSTMFWIMRPWINCLQSCTIPMPFTLVVMKANIQLKVVPERPVLNRERATGTYRLSAYFIGKMLAETPLEMVHPFIFAVIAYYMVSILSSLARQMPWDLILLL